MLYVCEGKSLIYRREGETLQIDAYGPGVLRVRSVPGSAVLDQNWTLLAPKPADVEIKETPSGYAITNGNICCEITERKGQITFYDKDGNTLLQEEWTSERDLCGRYVTAASGDLFRFETQFFPNEGEHLYGMGMEAHDVFDLKGTVIELCQQNTKITIPFVVSSKGYGFLWNNPGIGRAEFGCSRTRWVVEQSRQMDYLVFAEGSIAANVKKYAEISGYAPEFPFWATGLWQSKLRYTSQQELLDVAREYKKRDIPVSMMVCDFHHWTRQGEWKFEPTLWPDPQGMVQELKDMGMELLVSVWPTVDPRSENFSTMKERNMLIRTDRGMEFLIWFAHGPQTYMDTTNPDTQSFVWSKVDENYYKNGITHFWLDESEPEFLPYEYDNLRYTAGSGMEVSSLYPYYYSKMFYDGLRQKGETEIVNLVRSAFIGSQRLGAVVWSGDIPSTFNSLRRQIKAGLNLSLTAYPWWTTDIGGFHGGDPDSEAYREVMIRWFQFGAFCPVLRMHGNRANPDRVPDPPYSTDSFCQSGGPNEIWSFGEKAYQVMRRYTLIRERLRPYIKEQFDLASQDGTPVTRPMVWSFPDPECYQIFDQYMFGPDLMVCPVCEAGISSRKVYLPQGTNWRNAYTGELFAGGQWIVADAPLESIPLFLTENAKLSVELFE